MVADDRSTRSATVAAGRQRRRRLHALSVLPHPVPPRQLRGRRRVRDFCPSDSTGPWFNHVLAPSAPSSRCEAMSALSEPAMEAGALGSMLRSRKPPHSSDQTATATRLGRQHFTGSGDGTGTHVRSAHRRTAKHVRLRCHGPTARDVV